MVAQFVLSAVLASLALAVPAQSAACDSYVINNTTHAFASRTFIDFSKYSAGADAASILSQNGFYISGYPITDSPYSRTFTRDNVQIGQGTLNMRVLPAQGNNVPSSEIQTVDTFLYGSVRVVYQASSTPGVCEGNFFYRNQEKLQEVDWEILTSTVFNQIGNVPAGIWATNQAFSGKPKVSKVVPFTFDPRLGFHEYRIDWTAGATIFYIDGVEKVRHTSTVPDTPMYYIFNAWSNGDVNWSNGPPTKESITRIRSIDLYKGYLPKAVGRACGI